MLPSLDPDALKSHCASRHVIHARCAFCSLSLPGLLTFACKARKVWLSFASEAFRLMFAHWVSVAWSVALAQLGWAAKAVWVVSRRAATVQAIKARIGLGLLLATSGGIGN